MDMDTDSDLETKASFSPDRPMTYGEFMSAFDEFKAGNEDRLAQIERRGAADPLTEDKQARIDVALQRQLDRQQQQINELTLKHARPAFGRDRMRRVPSRRARRAGGIPTKISGILSPPITGAHL